MPNYNPELVTAAGAPSETGQAVVLDPLTGHENYVLGRIDYNISSKDTLFVRYVLDYAQRNFTTAWFNTACFALQPIGTYGNAGRDTIIGPNLWNLDNSLTKDFRIREAVTIQFRAEAFNIMNHPSFQLLATNTQIFAGTALNASAGKIQATNSQPRQVQLALKLLF